MTDASMLRTDPKTVKPEAVQPTAAQPSREEAAATQAGAQRPYAEEGTPEALRQSFLEAMRRVAQTVTVVATDGPAGRAGATVSAFTSVSMDGDGPTILVCLNATSHCAATVEANGVLAVNVLGIDGVALSNGFAGRYVEGEDKFASVAWHAGRTGAPILDQAVAAFECRVQSSARVGSHNVVIGEVVAMHLAEGGEALVYGNRAYGRLAPL